ncbi:nitric oxide synthase oxygenase [Cohnella faecalis]|uniref:nitric oxide synthase oxygenase n=1 Tax=Cohnella faecalis TaxID=2315694 RepID=UPI003610AA84
MKKSAHNLLHPTVDAELIREAESFLRTCHQELGKSEEEAEIRVKAMLNDVGSRGTYTHTNEELVLGARMAWRNSNRCIGRLFWNRLHVIDARDCQKTDDVWRALLHHIEFATNGGEIRPVITVLPPCNRDGSAPFRIWNHQLLRYAGYETQDGIVGDPASVRLTRSCMDMGWKSAGTPFDLLPLVIQRQGEEPKLFSIPKKIVMEVPIAHPEYDLFQNQPVKWYAVPIISDMELEIGGIRYPAAPFNGWYMGTEIGARNLADEARYNMLPIVARSLGLDTSSASSLWKDRALLELNVAVLNSFKARKASIVDHHTAAQQFAMFQRNEEKSGRDVTGRWSWLIPPMSPATTAIFHESFNDKTVTPNFFPRQAPY